MTSDRRHGRHRDVDPDPAVCRKPTDFTIEHILNRAGATSSIPGVGVNPAAFYNYLPLPETAAARHLHNFANDKCYQEAQELNDNFDSHTNGLPFTWLHCTRYCPPKVPRKKEGPQKRQLGRHPRIPFTSHQLSVLEERFKQSPYLSSEEVTKTSRILDLADIRVKIWFQNRRARERREKVGGNASFSPPRSTPPSSPSKE